jgi:hypothetical protein
MEGLLMNKNYELYNNYKIAFETPDDGRSYFFGYYDKSPLNIDNTKLLAHRVSFDGRDVQDGDIAEIGYFDLNTNEFVKLDETLAWNWQQGSQLQWLPPKYDEEIIYNSIVDDKFVSIIYNLNTKEKRVIPFPIYVVHPNGKEALGINYERYYWCRYGYNYQNIKNKQWDKPYHEEDGIYKIDLESGDVKLIVKITDIINNDKLPEFETSNNWLEHMMYNPSGNRFMFFHRWHESGVDHTRLYTVNAENGEELFFYPDNRFYSHAYWKNDDELTIWSMEPKQKEKEQKNIVQIIKSNSFLKAILRPIYRFIVKPFLTQASLDKISPSSKLVNYVDQSDQYEVVGRGILSQNGHNSWSKDKNIILNDSYDDEKGYRHLELYNTKENKLIKVGKFYSTYNSCGYRADLHPRFSLNEKYIVIDSAHEERRKILIININKD